MGEFLQECFVPAGQMGTLAHAQRRAEEAATELTAAGTPVCLVGAIVVPDEETWFLLWQAEAVESVYEVARRADLDGGRVSRTVVLKEYGFPGCWQGLLIPTVD